MDESWWKKLVSLCVSCMLATHGQWDSGFGKEGLFCDSLFCFFVRSWVVTVAGLRSIEEASNKRSELYLHNKGGKEVNGHVKLGRRKAGNEPSGGRLASSLLKQSGEPKNKTKRFAFYGSVPLICLCHDSVSKRAPTLKKRPRNSKQNSCLLLLTSEPHRNAYLFSSGQKRPARRSPFCDQSFRTTTTTTTKKKHCININRRIKWVPTGFRLEQWIFFVVCPSTLSGVFSQNQVKVGERLSEDLLNMTIYNRVQKRCDIESIEFLNSKQVRNRQLRSKLCVYSIDRHYASVG
ncbi:hypothetical protein CEXT_366301 [Caerostris extrusa]|uniref:Uncharacterized protein n=1 Tax=Caerostris extrusa TaxID=172846 RepID=A0AAV4MTL0_CAEEX|nr:hypothetical protein CEXT_366301 [Caerostris extrusa]